MKVSQFILENISNLEHFIEQGGYPIRSRREETDPLLKCAPKAFAMKDGLLTCNPKLIPTKIMAAFYKFKYLEAKEDANKMYKAIDEAYSKANS